jgi:tRNA-specific 2-thiouridylase
MSGGVDSSVTAALLKEQGYDVVGVYMKNWTKSLPGFDCPWKEDFADAKRVAVQLGIEFKVFDFEKQYKQKVVDYMIDEFKAGRTPNPDIMCNQEVKFKLFLDTCLEDGADLIATGHYARVENSSSSKHSAKSSKLGIARLLKARDDNKDQTYFLYRITDKALSKTLFPLGEYTKPEVRKLAKKFGLATAEKKESMGICFVGKVGIKEFLSQYVKTKPGNIINESASGRRQIVGEHDGAIFYTIGQRSGLGIGGGLPYYVTGKDMKKNEVYVTTNLDDKKLWYKELNLTDVHWINNPPEDGAKVQVRTRHRAPLIDATLQVVSKNKTIVTTKDEIRAVTPGQSAVIYDGDSVLGGGIIC